MLLMRSISEHLFVFKKKSKNQKEIAYYRDCLLHIKKIQSNKNILYYTIQMQWYNMSTLISLYKYVLE